MYISKTIACKITTTTTTKQNRRHLHYLQGLISIKMQNLQNFELFFCVSIQINIMTIN